MKTIIFAGGRYHVMMNCIQFHPQVAHEAVETETQATCWQDGFFFDRQRKLGRFGQIGPWTQMAKKTPSSSIQNNQLDVLHNVLPLGGGYS